MTSAPFVELAEPGTRLMPLHVDQYHDMIAKGILPEGAPWELIDGLIKAKNRGAVGESPMTVGLEHSWAVTNLEEFNRRLSRLGCHMRTQQPVTLPPYNEPEPDGAIIIGPKSAYRKRRPGARDVACVIEVADSSLRDDRTSKQRVYANSGIPQYVIINLPDRVVEVYTQPLVGKDRYGQSVTLGPSQTVALRAARGRELKVAVRRLLP